MYGLIFVKGFFEHILIQWVFLSLLVIKRIVLHEWIEMANGEFGQVHADNMGQAVVHLNGAPDGVKKDQAYTNLQSRIVSLPSF